MKVRAQFYAQLRDLVGSREMDVDLAEGATVGDLLDQIYAQQPKLRPHDKSILIGAGVEFVDRNYKLKPGDEISIMPPSARGIIKERRSLVRRPERADWKPPVLGISLENF